MTTDGRRYRVLGVLGKGGFGTVYRAEMLGEGGFRRQVALKMLNSDMDAMPEIAQRLRDEARLLGMLRHRAILQGDGLVVLDDRWTVVMEYIDGVDLQIVGRKKAVPAGCALEIISEVASALHVAYSQPTDSGEPLRLIHRDIKPSNILLTAIGETKVLDFGIARANFAGREARTKGMRFGSPGYMAPERLDFEEGPAGDVYALGVVLAELVSGDLFGPTSVRPDRHQSLIEAAGAKMRLNGATDDVIAFMAELAAYEPERRPVARDVERRCRELRGRLPAPWLRDWAEEVVPPILNLRGLGSIHDLSNSVLVERSGGTTSATMSFDGPEVTEPVIPVRSMPTFSDEADAPATPPTPIDAAPPPRVKRPDPPTLMPTPRSEIAAPPSVLPPKPAPTATKSAAAAPPPPTFATARPKVESSDIPPPKVKIDNNPTPAPARQRTESVEVQPTPTDRPQKPTIESIERPQKPKTESSERSQKPKTESSERPQKPKTESIERKPKTGTREVVEARPAMAATEPLRPRAPAGPSLTAWMGVATAVLVVLCLALAVVAAFICLGLLATG